MTFNAPGMRANKSDVCASPPTAQNDDLGINYIMWGDVVGNFGPLYGIAIEQGLFKPPTPEWWPANG